MSEITFETAKAAAMPYINATCNFASSNWGAFKNVTVEYGTTLYNTETVQQVVKTASPYLTKVTEHAPKNEQFYWALGAAAFLFTVLFCRCVCGRSSAQTDFSKVGVQTASNKEKTA